MTLLISDQIIIDEPIKITFHKSKILSSYQPVQQSMAIVQILSPDVSISNIEIDGNGKDHVGINANNVQNLKLKGIKIHATGIHAGIRLEGVQHAEIKSSNILENINNNGDVSWGAIYINNCEHIHLCNIRVEGFYGKGINFRNTKNSSATECNIKNLNTVVSDGLYAGFSCYNVVFSKCTVENVGGNGIKFSRRAQQCSADNCVISGMVGNGASGILFQGVSFCNIFRSAIQIGGDKIAVLNIEHPESNVGLGEGGPSFQNYVSSCHIISEATSAPAIKSDMGSVHTVSEFNIQENVIEGGGFSIAIFSPKTFVLNNNIYNKEGGGIRITQEAEQAEIFNNVVEITSSQNVAILVDFSLEKEVLKINNNNIKVKKSSAVYLQNVRYINVSDNIITGVNPDNSIGIVLASAVQNISIIGNVIRNFDLYGVYSDNLNNENIIVSNNQFDGVISNYLFLKASYTRVVGNVFTNSGAAYFDSANVNFYEIAN